MSLLWLLNVHHFSFIFSLFCKQCLFIMCIRFVSTTSCFFGFFEWIFLNFLQIFSIFLKCAIFYTFFLHQTVFFWIPKMVCILFFLNLKNGLLCIQNTIFDWLYIYLVYYFSYRPLALVVPFVSQFWGKWG
jgi:hypothetical protein